MLDLKAYIGFADNFWLYTEKCAEFIYPESWVGDQTVLYRAAGKAESERPLDPPPLVNGRPSSRPPRSVSEPVAAFGPPGSNGELNVSVIVSDVPRDFAYVLASCSVRRSDKKQKLIVE